MLYDSLAVFAVCFVAGGLVVVLRHGNAVAASAWWFKAYLVCASYLYFGYCWRHGQTLGMRSWKIKIVDYATGGVPSWRQTGLRFVVALLSWLPAGFGFWRATFDREHRGWPDLASSTRLVRL
jgi:uncharacterized RDD family membrane protein YckC